MNAFINRYTKIVKDYIQYLEIHKDSDPFPVVFKFPQENVYIPLLKIENLKKSPTTEKKVNIGKSMNLTENQKCNLCKDRLYAVKKFIKDPLEFKEKKILLLISNNSFVDKSFPFDASEDFLFSKEEDEVLERILSLIQYSLKNVYVQEFVACHFRPDSTLSDWDQRTKNCFPFLEKTILEKKIDKVLVIGNAAIFLFGDHAKDFAKTLKIVPLKFQEKEIPSLIMRSPSAILFLEKKRKEFEEQLKKYPEEYKLFIENKGNLDNLKKELEAQVISLKETVIENVKLKKASQIKTQEQKEKEIQQKLGKAKFVLYKYIHFREQEIHVKEQIKNAIIKFSEI